MVSSDHHSAPTAQASEGHTFPTFGITQTASLRPSRRTLLDSDVSGSRFIVLMGVSGTGKSTLGAALSETWHLPFIDGDDLHPAANVAKMSRGEPLDDADRQPWLEAIRDTAVARVLAQLGATTSMAECETGTPGASSQVRDEAWRPGVIIACSALKKAYRAVLRGQEGVRGSVPTYFVYLKGERDVLMARMQSRQGHFMKAGMLESQLDTLESPEGEPGVVTVSAEMSTKEQVQKVVETFRSQGR